MRMLKRRKIAQPVPVMLPRQSQFAAVMCSKDTAELIGSFCMNGWLATLALTCKAAYRATYMLTAREKVAHGITKLVEKLQHNPTWAQHPARLAYVRGIWIAGNNIAPVFPAGLTGVEILTSQSPCTSRSPFPAGLKKLIATKFSFQPKNKQPPPVVDYIGKAAGQDGY